MDFNAAITAAWRKALEREERLADKYEQVLRRIARRAAEVLTRTQEGLIAAGEPPKMGLPAPEELLSSEQIREQAQAGEAARRALLKEFMREAAANLGFVYTAEMVDRLLLAHRARFTELLGDAVHEKVAEVILRAFSEGWSIPQAAKGIQEAIEGTSKVTARALARTDLIGLANAGSLASARAVDPESRPRFKMWLATPDERTRADHREADRQVVPLDAAFAVGGEHLQYPGDPAGSDSNVINCRCTLIYMNDPAAFAPQLAQVPDLALAAAAWNPEDHPRHPAGSEDGGKFAPREGVGRRTKAGDALVRRLVDNGPESVKGLWDLDPQDSIATDLDLDDAPRMATIQSARATVMDVTQEYLRRLYPDGQVPIYRGGPDRGTPAFLSWSTDPGVARYFAKKTGMFNERVVPVEAISVSLEALRREFGGQWSGYDEKEVLVSREVESLAAAAWNEEDHPRDPGGEDGGQFIEKGSKAAGDSLTPRTRGGFPPGEWDPHGDVKFWPEAIASYSGWTEGWEGPFWKALVREDGHEAAFWFVGAGGKPHHAVMRQALIEEGVMERKRPIARE